MFEDITALEKEVQEFQKNILASKELVGSLQSIAAEAKAQSASFEQASAQLGNCIRDAVKDIETQSDQQIAKAVAQITEAERAYEERARELEQQAQTRYEEADGKIGAAVDRISQATDQFDQQVQTALTQLEEHNDRITSDALAKISEAQVAYETRVQEAENSITAKYQELLSKFESLTQKLESVNRDETADLCRKISSSINVKFGILLVGIGASLALVIYSILMK